MDSDAFEYLRASYGQYLAYTKDMKYTIINIFKTSIICARYYILLL